MKNYKMTAWLIVFLLVAVGCRKPLYTVTVTVRGAGQIVFAEEVTEAAEGTELSFAAVPEKGWQFVSWEGTSSQSEKDLTITVTENIELTGVFARMPVLIPVSVEGRGSVAGIGPGEEILYGNIVTLDAQPEPGWSFVQWQTQGFDAGESLTTANPLIFEAGEEQEVTAVFEQETLSVQTGVMGAGSVTSSHSQEEPLFPGDMITIEAQPADAWYFSHWEGSLPQQAEENENPISITLEDNITIQAVFKRMYEIEWRLNLGDETFSTAAVGPDGTMYIGSENGRLTAFDQDGKRLWIFSAGGGIKSSPALGSDAVYVGSRDKILYAVDFQGRELWRFETGGSIVSSPAVGQDGTIYVGSGDRNVYALRPDGSLLWQYQTRSLVNASPVIGRDGSIYIGGMDKYFYALTREGDLQWRIMTGFGLETDPAVGSDGTIYFGSADRHLYAVSPEGKVLWKFLTDNEIYASPAIGVDGTIYIGSDDYSLYAVNPDGTRRWKYDGGGAFIGTPLIGESGTIYSGNDDAHLYALNSDGTLKWKLKMGGPLYSSAALGSSGRIVIGSMDGRVYGSRVHGETEIAESSWPAARGGSDNRGWSRQP